VVPEAVVLSTVVALAVLGFDETGVQVLKVPVEGGRPVLFAVAAGHVVLSSGRAGAS